MSAGGRRRQHGSGEWGAPAAIGAALVVTGAAALAAVLSYSALNHVQAADDVEARASNYTATPMTGDEPDAPAVLFIGDSYTAGAGASSPAQRWSSTVADELGWIEINEARGGTGYLTTSSFAGCGLEYCPTYSEVIEEANADPSIVVVNGGRNDVGSDLGEFTDAVRDTLNEVSLRWPEATLDVTNPLWDDNPAPNELLETDEAVESVVTDAGGVYLDLGQPLEGEPSFVSDDSIHPSDAGHAAIAEAFLAAMR